MRTDSRFSPQRQFDEVVAAMLVVGKVITRPFVRTVLTSFEAVALLDTDVGRHLASSIDALHGSRQQREQDVTRVVPSGGSLQNALGRRLVPDDRYRPNGIRRVLTDNHVFRRVHFHVWATETAVKIMLISTFRTRIL